MLFSYDFNGQILFIFRIIRVQTSCLDVCISCYYLPPYYTKEGMNKRLASKNFMNITFWIDFLRKLFSCILKDHFKSRFFHLNLINFEKYLLVSFLDKSLSFPNRKKICNPNLCNPNLWVSSDELTNLIG